LCEKAFAACGGRILFLETPHFRDFAKRNRENEASLKALFGAERRENSFYTTSKHSLARSTVKILFIQRLSKHYLVRSVKKNSYSTPKGWRILVGSRGPWR
jgi:hypothetical protein